MTNLSENHTSAQFVDSHTGGEPTRIIVSGGPELGTGTLSERLEVFRDRFDDFRKAVVLEPRGSEELVGGLLVEPHEPDCSAGILFFNNVGMLGMCGHGTIGLAVTLAHLERIETGKHRIDTPVGAVTFELEEDGWVSLENVPSYRLEKDVTVEVENHGPVTGQIAWGGNWFFLVEEHGQEIDSSKVGELTGFSKKIRQALERGGITGENGAEIDHVELFGPSESADSKNFVLCPGGAYDRSPCGTGTSAKIACLIADGKLEPGQTWKQESVIGSIFEATAQVVNGKVIPTIRGSAHVTSEGTLLFNESDPFRSGIST
jgi:4-hydroxyproline epimerase